jgi:hypothetical protein
MSHRLAAEPRIAIDLLFHQIILICLAQPGAMSEDE